MLAAIFAFLTLLVPVSANAGMNGMFIGSRYSASTVDCTCNGTDIWETGNKERFEKGADDWCTDVASGVNWSITENSGVVNTYDTAQPYTCAYSFSSTATFGQTAYITANITDDADYSLEMWLRVPDVSAWTAATYITILYMGGAADKLQIQEATDTPRLVTNFSSSDTSVALTANTWYRVVMRWTQNASCNTVIYNTSGGTVDTLTATAHNVAVTTIQIGQTYNNTGQTVSLYFDDMKYTQTP